MARIGVVGAGIGGLTAALAMAGTGAEVRLFERAAALEEAGAGLQLAPNATRVLRDLGLLDPIDAVALRPEGARIRRGGDGAELARFAYGRQAEQRYGAPFLVLHRADLQSVLIEATRQRPEVDLVTGAQVEDASQQVDHVTLTSRAPDGTRQSADLEALVGADGLQSRIRTLLGGGSGTPVLGSGKTAWRALVPADLVAPFAREPLTNLWLGPDLHLVHYPIRAGRLINVVAIVAGRLEGADAPDFWARPGEPATIRTLFRSWCGQARALVEAAGSWRVWPLFDKPPLPSWSRGRMTLLGDAAHPMLPFLAQGASQAIEDAGALGRAIEGSKTVVEAFSSYEAARRERAARVQRDSRRQSLIYHLRGPAALARDLAMRAAGPERLMRRYDYIYRA